VVEAIGSLIDHRHALSTANRRTQTAYWGEGRTSDSRRRQRTAESPTGPLIVLSLAAESSLPILSVGTSSPSVAPRRDALEGKDRATRSSAGVDCLARGSGCRRHDVELFGPLRRSLLVHRRPSAGDDAGSARARTSVCSMSTHEPPSIAPSAIPIPPARIAIYYDAVRVRVLHPTFYLHANRAPRLATL